MISLDRLREVKQVVYHQSCPDGTAAALICFAAFRKLLDGHLDVLDRMPDFKSVQYNTNFFDNKFEARPGQLFVDITPPRAKWEQWKEVDPIVLDHHDTAKHITLGLGGIYGENSERMSGARMAFEHVMKPVLAECRDVDQGRDSNDDWEIIGPNAEFWDEFSRLAAIRDTWQEDDPDFEKASIQAYGLMTLGSKEVLDALEAKRFDPGLITRLGEKDYGRAKWVAEKSRRYELPFPKLGRSIVARIYNCTEKKYISDGCHHLLRNGTDLAISYFVTTDEETGLTTNVVSLRSNEPFAGPLAKSLDGGGHEKASGFGIKESHAIGMDGIMKVVADGLLKLQ